MNFASGNIQELSIALFVALVVIAAAVLKQRTSLIGAVLKFLLFSCLIIAWFQPYREIKRETSNAILLLDVSESMDESTADSLLSKLSALKSSGLEILVSPFAAMAASQTLPLEDGMSFRRIKQRNADLNIGETSLEEPFRNLLNSGDGAVFLLSDGQQTKGNVESMLGDLRAAGIKIFPLVPDKEYRELSHLHISQLYAPLIAPLNHSVDIRVSLNNPSSETESGIIEVFHDTQKVLSQQVSLGSGSEALIVASSDPSKEGIREVTAIYHPLNSKLPPSTKSTYLSGESREKVLLLNGSRDDARFLETVLSDQAYQLKSLVGNEASRLPELKDYSVVIFNNIARSEISPSAPEQIEEFVKRGGGFIMIGGNKSFGLGDYRNSRIEDLLPLRLLPPQTKEKRLNIAVELVLDKSKSMAEDQKIEFVKDAAREVVKNLKDDDLVGVVGFDSSPFVALPLGQVSSIRSIAQDRISIMFPTGKTNLLPAMNMAREALERAAAGRKHMIILTDGDLPDAGPHYVEFVRQMRFSGITVSTVLIAQEFDRLLRNMAETGGGAFYNTTDPQALPRIFLRDIKVRSGEESMKEQSELQVKRGPGTLNSTNLRAFPPLAGFVQTQSKDRANLELVVSSQDNTQAGSPLLASWSYEKGKSLAFTSDANGRWSKGWIEWPRFREFWGELVKSAQPSLKDEAENVKFDLRSYLEGASLILDLALVSKAPSGKFSTEVILPNGTKQALTFTSLARGHYRAEIPSAIPGKYEFHGTFDTKKLTPVAFEVSGELFGEKKGRGFNIPLLEELAGISGGKVNPGLENIKASKTVKTEKADSSAWFIALSILLFALDILVRELPFRLKSVQSKRP